MKANELQIGDWVSHFDEGKNCVVTELRGRKVAVSYTDDNGNTKYSDLLPEMAFEPIPLTAEILEKNGFLEFMPHNWQTVIDNIMIELREPEHNMAIWLDWEHYRDVYASYMLPRPNCVHELQHALRLCNIEKEIEL